MVQNYGCMIYSGATAVEMATISGATYHKKSTTMLSVGDFLDGLSEAHGYPQVYNSPQKQTCSNAPRPSQSGQWGCNRYRPGQN